MRKYARLVIAVFGVVFAAFVALQFKRHAPAAPPAAVVRTDPNAVVESTGGDTLRFRSSREDVRVQHERLLTYPDGTSKLVGVTISTQDRNVPDRSFVVTAKEGRLGTNESSVDLDGDVQLTSSDGFSARTPHAVYTAADGAVNAAGLVEFAKRRLSGRGTGLLYDKNHDSVQILANAVIHIEAEAGEKSGGPTEVSSGTATYLRKERLLQFTRDVHIRRGPRTMEADLALAHLSEDEKRIHTLELHNRARITGGGGGSGGLQSLTGADMTLNYGADGQSLEHAVIVGDAVAQLAGDAGAAGPRITARLLDITMAADGATPVALSGQDAVQLALPADANTPARTIEAEKLDSKGEGGRGLTHATFTGSVRFHERGAALDRRARSSTLDVAMKPGLTAIEDARFRHAVRFEEGALVAQAAAAQYAVAKGALQLTGSEPGFLAPRVVNERIAVDATRIDVVLDGPGVRGAGAVKSTLESSSSQQGAQAGSAAKLPAMLKQDQPVTVLADNLAYDGGASLATYTGTARLFQGDTTIRADSITIDEHRGDLTATGDVMTTTVREQEGKAGRKERVQSTASAAELHYEDALRRLTYSDGAHLVGPEGDVSASRIELYLRPSGDQVERAEAYAEGADKLTLREQSRTTTGTRMTYTAERETYVVTGIPATVLDECGRETTGRTLTFVKSTDTIVVDGNQQIRTQTKGGSGKCG